MIRLSLPAELRYRDVAVRTVAAACKLVGQDGERRSATMPAQTPENSYRLDLSSEFDVHVVSAFSEAFNNIAIHAYGRRGGHLDIEMHPQADRIMLYLRDSGQSFDPARVNAPELDSLPEGGMGLFIIQSFLDEFTYTPGPPNVWCLTKCCNSPARQVGALPTSHRLDG